MSGLLHIATIPKRSGGEIRIDLDPREEGQAVLVIAEWIQGRPTGRDIFMPMSQAQVLGAAIAKAQVLITRQQETGISGHEGVFEYGDQD